MPPFQLGPTAVVDMRTMVVLLKVGCSGPSRMVERV
jgi:hypothetical protein